MPFKPVTIYAVEILDGAEYDCWVVDSLWSSREMAEKYAKSAFRQCNWGSPVPSWSINEYVVDKGR